MQLSGNSNNPRLESLITGIEHSVETEVDEEDEVYAVPDIAKEGEGLGCVTDCPMRLYAYLYYILTFSWINLLYTGFIATKIALICKVTCQMSSLLLMLLTIASRIAPMIVQRKCNESTFSYKNEYVPLHLFLLEIGYDIAAGLSLAFLIHHSYSPKKELNPHKLIVSTKQNRSTIRKIYSNQIVRNSMRGNVSYKLNTGITFCNAIMALWVIGVSVIILALVASVYVTGIKNWNSTIPSSSTLKECQEIYKISSVIQIINAPQRFLAPIIVCYISWITCRKIESDIKLNSTDTYTRLIIAPNTADIKGRYFRVVRHVCAYSDKFSSIIAVNALCSLLGVVGIASMRILSERELIEEMWANCTVLKVYVSYFVLLSCVWMALQGITRYSEMFKRYPDEVFGFVSSNKNITMDRGTQSELNIVANSANGNQGSSFSSRMLTALKYLLLAGMVAILIFEFEGMILYLKYTGYE